MAATTTLSMPTFLLGIVVLTYLSTFVIFAVVRILTGVSIQRLGYLSLKRISYEPRDGLKLEVRKLGLSLHRPTFAQPTWVSILVQDSQVSVDLREKEEDEEVSDVEEKSPNGRKGGEKKVASTEMPEEGGVLPEKKNNRMEKGIEKLKDSLKNVHSAVKWLKMVDIVMTNTNLAVVDVGSIQIGSMNMMIDTRKKTADRSRLFDHCMDLKENQMPLEWMFSARSVLFFIDNKEPIEILNHCMFNIYGVLQTGVDAIREVAAAIKFGKLSIPCDELLVCAQKLKGMRKKEVKTSKMRNSRLLLKTVMEEISMPGSQTERIAETITDSKEFLQYLFGGVKEIQFAIGYLFISQSIQTIQPSGKPLQLIVSMKELGVDIHRLDQKSPAHLMYFSPEDIAHQALLAAISVSVSVDDGIRQDKLLYIPMVTVTSKTTLPSKTIQIVESLELDRNANILFANMVVTSPSLDLEPRHLPILLAIVQSRSTRASSSAGGKTRLISRLLPKASIKFSIHEPVIRILLPSTDPQRRECGDMDMLISSSSSVSADVESLHEAEGQSHYSLSCAFRVTSHNLYYRCASGEKHELLQTETFDLKAQVSASPEVQVNVTATLETLVVRLVRPEIVEGIKQMVGQFRRNVKPDKLNRPRISTDEPNFLRRIPLWLNHFRLDGRDFSVEIAGVDAEISEFTRGAALQMESWSIEYMSQGAEGSTRHQSRRRTGSRTLSTDDTPGCLKPTSRRSKNPTDGRKLSVHAKEIEGFMVDSPDSWEQDPFLNVPHFEMDFSTSTDMEGNVMTVTSRLKSFFFNYSLYRHYTVIVASKIIKEAFGGDSTAGGDSHADPRSPTVALSPGGWGDMDMMESPLLASEFISFDMKIQHFKVKAAMPDDPPMMLEVFGLDVGRLRWGFPFMKAKNIRLYTDSPTVKGFWARIISIRHFRLDMREGRRKVGVDFREEKSVDFSADAIRLAIPHQLILYKVTDNIINTAKACQQMHHRFKTGTNEYILDKKPEGPKNIPKITLRTKALLFELEDDPFETQLGLIYRLGLSEQKKRLAREAAFDAKVAKMETTAVEEEEEESYKRKSSETSRTGLKEYASSRFRGRSRTWKSESRQERGAVSPEIRRNKSVNRGRATMRYDPESAAGPSENASVSIAEARKRLNEHNSMAWIKRMKWAQKYHSTRIKDSREAFWGKDEVPYHVEETEDILGLPMRPALMASYFNDVRIVIDKPSFPLKELPKFMHRVGKGLPENTKFALLVPLSIKVEFSEARVLLRDYPLPFIHIPQMRPSQSVRATSWCLKSDFVLAEEFRGGPESMRHVKVAIVPPTTGPGPREGGFMIDVSRTVSPVKSYSDLDVCVNTSYATRITWCTSYQPAIQDMMMVFETFTKPHFDPSERTGFWDKIRLVLHSELSIAWKGDGDVLLTLKGSRDPYSITGDGAGFVMCWRGDVKWEIGRDKDPQKLVMVDSEEYLLAIPDFTSHARDDLDTAIPAEARSFVSSASYEREASFGKVVMKLSGNVRWLVGLMFEQEISNEVDWKQRKRSFEFKPHYEVTLKSPLHAKAPPGEVYDSFRGFRSHHLHLSLSILSPSNRDWSPSNTTPSTSYNTLHLSPRFFTHFYAWWGLFSGVMSLPIRQGPLWPGPEKSNKKFGRHLATIKYKLCLSPLFVSHIYKHNDKNDAGNDVVAAIGLKARLDAFMVDIHQRREESMPNPKSTTMKINQAELDFHSADIRAVSAVIHGTTAEELMKQATEPAAIPEAIRYSGDISQFSIPDGDYAWVDMDDFVELDWVMPNNQTPKTKIMPLVFTPRFTYFRQTDHCGSGTDVTDHTSPFGLEPSHDCMMSQNNDPREIQCGLVQARLEKVNQQIHKNKEALVNLAQLLKLNPEDVNLKSESEKLIQQSSILFNKLNFLQTMLRRMSSKLDDGEKTTLHDHDDQDSSTGSDTDSELLGMDSAPFADYVSDFDNRFIVHNMQAKWNNSLRDIILKYVHQVSQRRGFVYYMSRRAVKFILDIVEEQRSTGKVGGSSASVHTDYLNTGPTSTPTDDSDDELESRIQQLLDDKVKFVVATEDPATETSSLNQNAAKVARDDLTGDVAQDYVPQNSYHVRLIAPQIQMQSEKNKGAAVLVAAQGMQLKVVSIMDRDRIGDDVSGLVQRRFALNLDNTQFFTSHHQDFAPQSMSLHSANRYGAPSGSSWPPWVPLESMFDFRNNPVGFSRVVERTSATLRYDKHNSLRLKYSDQVSGMESGAFAAKGGPMDVERRIDHIWVDFPRVEASCDSTQYFAMYIIVLDLLLYAEPLEKLRSEKLEKIMLASDFSDLTGAPEMVECLQNRIHQLEEIKAHFQLNARTLDIEGWKGRVTVDQDLANCEEELFFMMKAITTAQRKHEDRSSQSSGVVRWYLSASEIIWHLLRDKADPLMDIRLQNAGYERIDNADGSNFNTVEVEMMKGFNLLPDAVYPEMIAPFFDQSRTITEVRQTKILRVYWHMLEAIAGIPVVDHFEVNLFPLKIQLEREIGERIFEYIFPGVGKSAFENGGFSPFLVRSMNPVPDDAESPPESSDEMITEEPRMIIEDSESSKSEASSAMDFKLRPTLTISTDRPKSSSSSTSVADKSRSFRFHRSLSHKVSNESFSAKPRRSTEGPPPSIMITDKGQAGRKRQLFHRSNSSDKTEQRSDELSQMMSRASNYMTLAYIKIPSVALCLSYKGLGDTNIEDVHEFVFRMPMLEYRNKTWSNLDLAIRLKKDIIRALISHTGAILQNKLTHHRPNRSQPNLLRMMANNGSLGTASTISHQQPDDNGSIYDIPDYASISDSTMTMSRPGTSYTMKSRIDTGLLSPRLPSREGGASSSASVRSSSFSVPSQEKVTTEQLSGGEEGDKNHGLFHPTTLSRHFSHLADVARHRDGIADESEESIKKKSRMLLGKKVFGGL